MDRIIDVIDEAELQHNKIYDYICSILLTCIMVMHLGITSTAVYSQVHSEPLSWWMRIWPWADVLSCIFVCHLHIYIVSWYLVIRSQTVLEQGLTAEHTEWPHDSLLSTKADMWQYGYNKQHYIVASSQQWMYVQNHMTVNYKTVTTNYNYYAHHNELIYWPWVQWVPLMYWT